MERNENRNQQCRKIESARRSFEEMQRLIEPYTKKEKPVEVGAADQWQVAHSIKRN